MFKFKLSALAAGAALLAGAIGSANALEILSGDYKIIFDNYDTGTTYATTPSTLICGASVPVNTAVPAANITDCNNAAASPADGTTADTAGILSIASITRVADNAILYTRGTATDINGVTFGPYLTGIFGGINDYLVANDILGQSTALGTGGFFNIYNNAADYDSTLGPLGAGVNMDTGVYPSITDTGTLFLSGTFAANAAFSGQAASYVSNFSGGALTGSGSGYLDFNGGTALSVFDQNNVTNANGGLNDAKLSATYDPTDVSDWKVISSGQVTGNVPVPEPGSLALVALALVGVGIASRRRSATLA